jgi:hypothetical protein
MLFEDFEVHDNVTVFMSTEVSSAFGQSLFGKLNMTGYVAGEFPILRTTIL